VQDDYRVKPNLTVNLGAALGAYVALGSPRYPTQEQIEKLNLTSELGSPETASLYTPESFPSRSRSTD
jgi:hypothetical protein